MLAVTIPVSAEEYQTARTERIEAIVPWVFGGLGLATSAGLFGTSFIGPENEEPLFTASARVGEKLLVTVPASAVFAASSYVVSGWFTRIILSRADTTWKAALWGAGLGALAGAAIFTPGWFVTMAIGEPMNIITTGDMSYPAVLGMSIVSGAFWGSLYGVLPGMVLGPTFQLIATR
jgi:hypothetical protein